MPEPMTTTDNKLREFAIHVEGVGSVVAESRTYDCYDDESPLISVRYAYEVPTNAKGHVAEEVISGLTVEAARALLTCLKAAIRHCEDLADGDAVPLTIDDDADYDD